MPTIDELLRQSKQSLAQPAPWEEPMEGLVNAIPPPTVPQSDMATAIDDPENWKMGMMPMPPQMMGAGGFLSKVLGRTSNAAPEALQGLKQAGPAAESLGESVYTGMGEQVPKAFFNTEQPAAAAARVMPEGWEQAFQKYLSRMR